LFFEVPWIVDPPIQGRAGSPHGGMAAAEPYHQVAKGIEYKFAMRESFNDTGKQCYSLFFL